ncbi:MAG: outer membrane lipoprotein-sorting protein [Methanosarcina sp.]|nr:outer membrane lipoprotein-sorting protein [Methanosarcina sp.]
MATKKALFLLALVILAIFTSGCTEKELSAEEITIKMLEKQDSIEDYSYTMHMTSYIGEKVVENELKTIYKKPHLLKNFIEGPGGKAETLVLSDGEFRWTYDSRTNTVMKTRIPETRELTENDYLSIIKISLNDTDLSLLGTEKIEGREAYLLMATPKEIGEQAPEYSVKVWIDKETWMFLGYEMYDANGKPVSKVEIRDLKVNIGIPDSEFEFKIPEGATIKTREPGSVELPEELSLEEAKERVRFKILIPEYLPEGYEFSHAAAYNTNETAPDGQAAETVVLKYMKKEESIVITETVYEAESPDTAIMNTAEEVSINGAEGKYLSLGNIKVLKWKLGSVDLGMTAPLEKAELLRIAESVSEA